MAPIFTYFASPTRLTLPRLFAFARSIRFWRHKWLLVGVAQLLQRGLVTVLAEKLCSCCLISKAVLHLFSICFVFSSMFSDILVGVHLTHASSCYAIDVLLELFRQVQLTL